jgi:hypothetical protein
MIQAMCWNECNATREMPRRSEAARCAPSHFFKRHQPGLVREATRAAFVSRPASPDYVDSKVKRFLEAGFTEPLAEGASFGRLLD